MSMDLTKFKAGIAKEREKLKGTLGKEAQIAVGQYVFERLIWRTPVLTGHARHNWRPSVNTQVDEEQLGVYGGNLTNDPITSEERGRWNDVKREVKAQPLGQTIWICNNVPYIQRLEHGYSMKAPNGMVSLDLREVLEGVSSQQTRMIGDDSGG